MDSSLHTLILQLGLSLLHFLWQGTLIGMLYGLGSMMFRDADPRTRYGLAVLTLALLALTPVATLAYLLLAGTAIGPGAASTPIADLATSSAISLQAGAQAAGLFTLLPWIVGAWLTGVLLLSLRLIGQWWSLLRLRKTADRSAVRDWRAVLEDLQLCMGIRVHVSLAASQRVRSPILIGWLKPMILLPASIVSGFPRQHVEMILAHELAHIRRYDHLVNLFQTVVEVLLFYHPVVAWVSRRVRVERESACDDLAVAATGQRLAYVEMLASLEHLRQHPQFVLAVSDAQILGRIRRLIKPVDRRLRGSVGPMVAVGIFALFLSGLSLNHLASDGGSSAPEPTSLEITPRSLETAADSPGTGTGATREPAGAPAEIARPKPDNPEFKAEAPEAAAFEPDTVAVVSEPEARDDEREAERERQAEQQRQRDELERQRQQAERQRIEREQRAAEEARQRELEELIRQREEAQRRREEDEPRQAESEPQQDVLATDFLLAMRAPEIIAPPDQSGAETRPEETEPVTGGTVRERVLPDYPQRALKRQIEGMVELSITVGPKGRVEQVELISAEPEGYDFERAAVAAVMRWQFDPYRRADEPISQQVRVEIDFNLREVCNLATGSRLQRC